MVDLAGAGKIYCQLPECRALRGCAHPREDGRNCASVPNPTPVLAALPAASLVPAVHLQVLEETTDPGGRVVPKVVAMHGSGDRPMSMVEELAARVRRDNPESPAAQALAASVRPTGVAAAVLDTDALLEERGKTHGSYRECCECSQSILRAMRKGPGWARMHDFELEAAQMIAHKQHRIAFGDPHHVDHWRDIAGYAQLVVKALEEVQGAARVEEG